MGHPPTTDSAGLYLDLLPAFAGNGVMYKCDRRYDRLAKGENPSCIEAFPEDAQTIGPRSEILEKAKLLANGIDGYIYGAHENGGTNTIYVSPIPFEQLNNSIEIGKGRPHFKKLKNMMADGSNIARTMLAAPIAGIAAAFDRFYLSRKEDSQ